MEIVGPDHNNKSVASPRHAYIDRSGKVIIEADKYEVVGSFSEELAAVKLPGQGWGYIDKSGKLVIEARFEEVLNFSEGLAGVRLGRRWGYIDRKGTVVIEPHYELADSFSQGVAVVIEAPASQVAHPPEIKGPRETVGRIVAVDIKALVREQNKPLRGASRPDEKKHVALIDKTGKTILSRDTAKLELTLDEPARFSEGVILAYDCAAERYGFMDKTGRFVIPPKFTEAGPFAEGLARVAVEQDGEEKLAFINHDGEFVIAPAFNTDVNFRGHSTDFSEGLASVTENLSPTVTEEEKFVYIDKKGSIAFFTEFFYAGRFREGLAAVYDADTDDWGYIDKSGKLAIPLQYKSAGDFSDGLAVVTY